ncbi:MAG: hypothetical protein ACQEXV_16415 [Bacillota bacterium]
MIMIRPSDLPGSDGLIVHGIIAEQTGVNGYRAKTQSISLVNSAIIAGGAGGIQEDKSKSHMERCRGTYGKGI